MNSTLLFECMGGYRYIYNANTQSISLFRNGALLAEKKIEFNIKKYESSRLDAKNVTKSPQRRKIAEDYISSVNRSIQNDIPIDAK